MPIYVYETKDGEKIDKVFSLQDRPKTITLEDGRVAKRVFAVCSFSGGDTAKGWPVKDFACGVTPGEVEERRAEFRKKGIRAEVHPDGDIIHHNAVERKDTLKKLGLHDRNSYG
jgi:predicted nucleic acid-binding Zn ribbon protein